MSALTQAMGRRDAGMDAALVAEENHAPGFAAVAYGTIVSIARRQATVHVDDVLAACEVRPKHHNAWGSVWARAIREGVIRRSGEVRLCRTDKRKNAHAYPVYRSRLFGRKVTASTRLAGQIEMFGGEA